MGLQMDGMWWSGNKKLRCTVIVLLAGMVIGVSAFAFISRSAPTASSVHVSTTRCAAMPTQCVRFPTVIGSNLAGKNFTLPNDFQGELNFVVIPFDENQQVKAKAWLPLAQELAATHPTLRYYNISILGDTAPVMRALITSGMAAMISDEKVRQATIMLFLSDKDVFLKALAIPDTSAIQVLLLSAQGDVLWRSAGEFSPQKGVEAEQAVEKLATRKDS